MKDSFAFCSLQSCPMLPPLQLQKQSAEIHKIRVSRQNEQLDGPGEQHMMRYPRSLWYFCVQ